MKKMLLATSALLLTAGIAAADYKIGGTGRVGIVYVDDDSFDAPGDNRAQTQVNMRLRFNFDASKELDSGVTLGGRIRMQYDQNESTGGGSFSGQTLQVLDGLGVPTGDFVVVPGGSIGGEGGADLSAAYLYAEVSGFRVEVGNVNTAFDSLSTLYNSELGYVGTTQGSYNLAAYTSFETNAYNSSQIGRMGLFASYTVGDLVARISYVNPDQRVEDLPVGVKEELSVSFDYKVGQFSFGAGYVDNGGFVDGLSSYALLGEYAINDTTNVGLQFIKSEFDGGGDVSGVTLYGNTEFNGIGVGAFISTTDDDFVEDDVAGGIGASYDLGGATLAGTIQKGFEGDTYADVGVRFSF